MNTLASFRNRHHGETIVVCGCGESLNDLKQPERFITIGVNDVGRRFDPTYLVVLNPRHQFKSDRFNYVEKSRAQTIFTQLDLGINHPDIVRFKLGKRNGTDFSDPNTLPYTQNSPYVALCLAAHMGVTRIGIIGVDFTCNHFFGKTGTHPLSGQFETIDHEYKKLNDALHNQGIEVFNLSRRSRLNAFPKMAIDQFTRPAKFSSKATFESKPLKIVSYATTPVAGVPAILARCIESRTPHACRCVWASNGYSNGVVYQGDVQWDKSPDQAQEILIESDLVIAHNGKIDKHHQKLISDKPVITMAHNYLWNVDQTFVKRGYPGIVVGQYQATLPEFKGWSVVPNPVPIWENEFYPGKKREAIAIAYTPSGKHGRYPPNHKLYWHSKGYDTTMRILDRLANRFAVHIEAIRHRQVSHAQSLNMKRRSHITIDECVTGSYHRNSLEGLSLGCVVLNGMGLLPSVIDVFRFCATNGKFRNPFIKSSLEIMEQLLAEMIESGIQSLLKMGKLNRKWMEQNWCFEKQWEKFWMPVVEQALKPPPITSKFTDQRAYSNASSSSSTRRLNNSIGVLQCTAGAQNAAEPAKREVTGPSIPVYWTCRGSKRGNFGDMLSPLIVRALSGRPTYFAQMGPRVFAVGSLLKFAHSGDLIWGSGFISAKDVCERGIKVSAVRGPMTRKKLLQLGIECPEIYGDPALLLAWLYRQSPDRRCGIGIIPHYVDASRVRASVQDPAVRVIDIRAGIEEVLRQANKCEVLLSSSLHGCVIGDAYGIPTVWVHISDKVVGGGFKFHDYYAGTGRETVCVDWLRRIDIDTAVNVAVKAPPPKLELKPLLLSFPYLHLDINSLEDLPVRHLDNAAGQNPRCPSKEQRGVAKDSGPRIARPQSKMSEVERFPAARSSDQDRRTAESGEPSLAIFSTGTENYAAYMVTSLRSFMQRNHGRPFDYYVLGHNFSAPSRTLLQDYGIHYLDIDLGTVFARRRNDRYPSECFWIFKGPELFHKMGYDYSLSLDGDTWCNQELDIDWLPQLTHIAGIDRGISVADFLSGLGQYHLLKAHFDIPIISDQRIATNTGVLFYNNTALAELGFFERVVEVYTRSEAAGISREGDDSTLALLLAVYPEIQLYILDELWNAYRGLCQRFSPNDPAYDRHLSHWIKDARIVHHIKIKPWAKATTFPNRVTRHFITMWRDLWHDTARLQKEPSAIPSLTSKSARPNTPLAAGQPRNSTGSVFPVRCYWYRGSKPNVGDETAPYLIKTIAGLSPHTRLRKRPLDPRKISEPVLLTMGSILRLCGANAVVWGSGIRNIDQRVADARRFCAVRGPLTRRRLLQIGYDCPETYGDPALLLPRYFRPKVNKRYALGIIPHLLDYPRLSKHYGGQPNLLVIDIATTDVESIVQQVLSCECTVSSALHGLVISIAYDIPTRWIRCSDKIMGDDTKFYDFFASLNPAVEEALNRTSVTLPDHDGAMEPYRPIRMEKELDPPQVLADQTSRHLVTIDLEQLLKACPFDGFGWKSGIL